ncbi:MAG: OmpA family protein [Deltaproteobacteria bacterium]|jgi:chemotaxis protein MotB|nr:OmpA family protein [Deltaproteobacteria bacterium]
MEETRPPKKSEETKIPTGAWLVTFSDMVTLLLTFFVLIIAITSVDPKVLVSDGVDEVTLSRIREVVGPGVLYFSNPSLLDPVVNLAEHLDEIPPDVNLNQDEIKSAIFQLDPNENDPGFREVERAVRESVSILRDERGLVIRWDDTMLFPEGSTLLKEDNLLLLARLSELFTRLTLPVSIECHTNPLSELEGGETGLAFNLSAERSKIILDYFTRLGLNPSRFRLGAFGGTRPVTRDPRRAYLNGRLELVIYKPTGTSWTG